MLGKSEKVKVSPEALQTIALIEISEKLGAILETVSRQKAKGVILSKTLTITTTSFKLVLPYSATIYNDGIANIYIIPERDRVIETGDAPLKSGESMTIAMGEQGEYIHYLKTLSGTATVRVFSLV